jgi:hypothetical protein
LAAPGCHGGPGITFIPDYNAGHQVLDTTAEPSNASYESERWPGPGTTQMLSANRVRHVRT